MILVTIGTNEQPFDRLVAAAARSAATSRSRPVRLLARAAGRGEWVDFMPLRRARRARMREARVVVCHAGVGSIMLARRCGQRPIVMPRRHDLGEAVDDHQLRSPAGCTSAGLVTLVEDERRARRGGAPAARPRCGRRARPPRWPAPTRWRPSSGPA